MVILKGLVNDLRDNLELSISASVNQKNLNTNSYLENLNFKWPIITPNYIQKIIDYLPFNLTYSLKEVFL